LKPLDTLYDNSDGQELPLPSELADFYGALRFPLREGKPYVIANMVVTLDGVASLGVPGKASGAAISGSNEQDVALMGLLRAAADAVVQGAGTLRVGQAKPLLAAKSYPALSGAYAALRKGLNKEAEPLQVIVTGSADLDPWLPIFEESNDVLVVTTPEGAEHARQAGLADVARVVIVEEYGPGKEKSIPAASILRAIAEVRRCDIVLLEGGPHLLADFLAEGLIDEQFLTLSPQVAGRDGSGKRKSLVEGRAFAPEQPMWGRLAVAKRGESHLFLRYRFDDA